MANTPKAQAVTSPLSQAASQTFSSLYIPKMLPQPTKVFRSLRVC